MVAEPLQPDEISQRVVTAIDVVRDLFTEMNVLFRLIHEGLERSEAGIAPYPGKGYLLPRARGQANVAERYVRADLGMLARIGGSVNGDEGEEEEEDEVEDVADEDEESSADQASVDITADSRLLAVRAILFDAAKKRRFRPVIVAAVLHDVQRFKRKQSGQTDGSFSLRRAHLRRLVKALPHSLHRGRLLDCRIPRFHLRATVADALEVELASLRTEEDVQRFIDRLVVMAAPAQSGRG